MGDVLEGKQAYPTKIAFWIVTLSADGSEGVITRFWALKY